MTGSPPPPSFKREQTRLSWPLIGFYSSCAGVSIGAAIAAAGWLWVGSVAALVVGGVMVVGGFVSCLRCLQLARRR